MSKIIDLTGQTFGDLIVTNENPIRTQDGRVRWNCQCTCGNKTIVVGKELRSKNTQSCGCKGSRTTIGDRSRTHGMSTTPTYSSWAAMIKRCTNENQENYQYYGGRGITVCDEWFYFENFLRDMGEKPSNEFSIERIDVDGNYCKDNCCWAGFEEQMVNLTTTHKITYKEKTQCILDWSEELDINYTTLYHRLVKAKWSVRDAFTTPIKRVEIEYQSRKISVTQLSKEIGISSNTLRSRLQRGWSLERIFSLPKARTKKGKEVHCGV